ncbi:MAG: ABC transporter permease [Rhodospirillaceae bacterium]|nr:ABC transporter permease [Rhodospirillaceae bacterium]
MKRVEKAIFGILIGAILIFVISPFAILLLFSFSAGENLSFPIPGWTLDWFRKLYAQREFWSAFQNSLIVTACVGVISTILGTMAAVGLVRIRRRAGVIFRSTLTLPLMLPPLVLGISFLTYFVTLGVPLDLSTVVVSHVVFTQPIVILIVYAGLENFDESVVHSARDLGASSLQAFFHITLPIIGPTVVGAALISMALSVDDFIITFFTIGGGNTLPTFMWGMLRKGMNPSINVVALTLMAITIGVSIASMRLIRYRG